MTRLLWAVSIGVMLAVPAAGQDAQPVDQFLRLAAQQAFDQLQFSVASGIGAAQSQPPRDTRVQTGTGRIRGRATGDNGQPLRRATVRLNFQGGARTATTDGDGRFEFTNLPAASFTIVVTKTGFVTAAPKTVTLADGQKVDDASIRVPRGGVISGQVLDEFGDPVVSATVVPMRMGFAQGRRQLTPAGMTAQSNDIGEFRLFGLTAGQYYLAVTPQRVNIGPNEVIQGDADSIGYATTYYPGTPDAASAQRIDVAAAQIVSNVTFTLVPTRLAKISGAVFDAEGRPSGRGNVTAMPRSQMLGMNATGAPVNADGKFVLAGVPPGDYMLRSSIPPPTPPAPGTQPLPPQFSVAYVTVNGDIDGVVLYPVKPVTVTGRIVFDDPGAAAGIKPSSIRVMAQAVNPQDSIGIGGAPPVVRDDLTFELKASPGQTILRVLPPPAPPNQVVAGTVWQMKGVWINGVNAIDTGVTLRAGEDVGNVELELTNRAQTVWGTVTDASGPVGDAWVVLFSQDRDQWTTPNNRYFMTLRTGPLGRFRSTNLPTGDYFAIAIPGPDNANIYGTFNDPEFLESAVRDASRFSLREGASTMVDLRPRASSR